MKAELARDVRSAVNRRSLRELNRSAAKTLVTMIDPDTQLFCHRVVNGADGPVREGISPRYTTMSLLGLNRWKQAGGESHAIKSVTEALLADPSWLDNIGDLGLMLWLSAHVMPEEIESSFHRLSLNPAFARLSEAKSPTMELAWLLTGLVYAAPLLPRDRQETAWSLAEEAYGGLIENQGKSGFFGHQSSSAGLRGRIRGHIGSFADQVYPIYALAQYGKARGGKDAVDRATRCADGICRAQGELGQWWWHYDARAGRTFQKYPVYSVHQDGMAPMCLWAAGEASGKDYSEWIYKGLSWIYGMNELGYDMREPSSGMIWRCIYSQGFRRRTREVLNLLGMGLASTSDLKVLYECRPYHLGWLLYAFAGRE